MCKMQLRRLSGLAWALIAGIALSGTPVRAQQVTSPFAGTGEMAPAVSTDLKWPQPTYKQPAATVQAVPANAQDLRTVVQMRQSAASHIEALLPPGVSLRTQGSVASFMSIGAPAGERTTAPQLRENIDPEQARELKEHIDPEQVRVLGGRRSAMPVQKWIVHYPVNYRNIPVAHFADVIAFIGNDGSIQSLRERNLPTSVDATSATVSASDARAAAVADAGSWANNAQVTAPEIEIWAAPDGSGKLAYRIEITSNDLTDPKARRYWISAVGTPGVIFWENMVLHVHTGQLTATIWTQSGHPTSPTANQELEAAWVNRSTGGTAVTGVNGLYAFTTGSGGATMNATVNGPNSKVDNLAGGEIARSNSGTPANPIDLPFNASGADELAQTSAFYWTNKAYDLAKDILLPTDLPNLPTNVNINGQCNAFWNGSSINFFKAGGNCPNMAYSDVVLHEYGHGVDARKGGIANGGYSEGFGDAMAVFGTRQSCVGRDFFGLGTCLRDAKELILWPPGAGDGVHAQGRRYAGFAWELIQQLKNTYSGDAAYAIATQLVMAAAQANPADIPDAVRLSFIADDDDGNLTNGTPHFKQLAAAADSRKIPRPKDPTVGVRRMGFAWAHDPTAASYTPSATYAFNSAGGPITATRSGMGQYAITFAGLGGAGTAGGNVQVTAYGSTSDFCKVASWGSGGDDFTANVLCFKVTGAPVDMRYTILITWP